VLLLLPKPRLHTHRVAPLAAASFRFSRATFAMSARDFLDGYPLSNFEKPEALITLRQDDNVLNVLKTLSQANVLCAPVQDGSSYTGVVDLTRLVNRHLLDKLDAHSSKADTGLAHLIAIQSLAHLPLLECR
jgi:hypothetical protein